MIRIKDRPAAAFLQRLFHPDIFKNIDSIILELTVFDPPIRITSFFIFPALCSVLQGMHFSNQRTIHFISQVLAAICVPAEFHCKPDSRKGDEIPAIFFQKRMITSGYIYLRPRVILRSILTIRSLQGANKGIRY
jgi:hypothetical protein